MERIKTALEKAKIERERLLRKSLQRQATNMETSNANSGDAFKNAILTRAPFSHCTSEQQRALLEDGVFLRVNEGETFQFAGEIDGYVHYLLEGVIVIESDNEQRSEMTVEHNAEIVALDKAGLKTRTLTAGTGANIFRIAQSSLPSVAQYASDEPLPQNLYTDTQSGKDLADLVERLDSETSGYESTSSDSKPDVPVGENTLGFNFDIDDLQEQAEDKGSIAAALSDLAAPGAEKSSDYEPTVNDDIGRFARQLDGQVRQYVETVREQEREKFEKLLEKHAAKLKKAAENKLREKIKIVRDRYQLAYTQKEQSMQDRLAKMRNFADQITRQKAAIYEARRGLATKLAQAEQLHNQLTSLGDEVNTQLDRLDDLMPDAEDVSDQTFKT
ncbi:MAG: hypothetical protein AAF387_08860 [Pseudomonadota bacterium]